MVAVVFPASETGLPGDIHINSTPTWLVQEDPWLCRNATHGEAHSHDRAACMAGHIAATYGGLL